jgi:hypothetical protein
MGRAYHHIYYRPLNMSDLIRNLHVVMTNPGYRITHTIPVPRSPFPVPPISPVSLQTPHHDSCTPLAPAHLPPYTRFGSIYEPRKVHIHTHTGCRMLVRREAQTTVPSAQFQGPRRGSPRIYFLHPCMSDRDTRLSAAAPVFSATSDNAEVGMWFFTAAAVERLVV